MKRLLSTVTMLGFLLGPTLLLISYAHAEFKCGGTFLTYEVGSPGSDLTPPCTQDNPCGPTGVRCVKYDPGGNELFVWYGEGKHGQRSYRHVGIAINATEFSPITGRAGDIYGNGEDYNNNVTGLNFQIEGNWPSPDRIRVTGTWQELWKRVDTANYTPLPSRPAECGDNFVKYTASSASGGPGTGLRCVLHALGSAVGSSDEGTPPYTTVWFGNGRWGAQTYTHVGRVTITNPPNQVSGDGPAGTGEAFDICDPRLGQFCNSVPLNSLRFAYRTFRCGSGEHGVPATTRPYGYHVEGQNWNENWTKQGCENQDKCCQK